jgi:hypothetical protein
MTEGEQSMNFFVWIRESVKRAVLLGVSDAMEQIGTPAEGDEAGQKLLASLREHVAIESQPLPSAANRKRLGRSLNQISGQARPAAS